MRRKERTGEPGVEVSESTNREKWDQLLESVGRLASIVERPLDARAQVTVQQNVDNLC